jgi:hypothetical protein
MAPVIYDDIRQFLQKNTDPFRGVKEKAYLKIEEESLGIPRGLIRKHIKNIIRGGGSPIMEQIAITTLSLRKKLVKYIAGMSGGDREALAKKAAKK